MAELTIAAEPLGAAAPPVPDKRPTMAWSKARPWLIYATILVLAIIIRLPTFGDPAPDFDEQLYHLAGLEMLKGHMPYIAVWDRKPLGLFAIYALAALLSGGLPIGYQIFAALSATLGACQVYTIGRRFGDAFASLVAATIYLIAFPLFAAPSGQSEVFYIPLLLAMLQLTIRMWESDTTDKALRPALVAMLLGGLAVQIKYTVLPQCSFFGLVALWRLWRLGTRPAALVKHAATFAALGLAPTVLVAAGYAVTGHFHEFFYANFQSIFARGRLHGPMADSYIRWILYGSSWLWVMTVIGIGLVVSGIRPARFGYWLVAGFVCASLVAMLMVGNIYVHYFIPAAAGLAMLSVPAFTKGPLGRLLAVIAILLAIGYSHFDNLVFRGRVDRAAIPHIAEELRPYLGHKRDFLFVYDGPMALYQATNSCLPTRFIFPDHLNNELERNSIGVDTGAETNRLFDARPGAVITTSLIAVPRRNEVTAKIVHDRLAQGYTRIDNVYFPPRILELFVRNDMVPPGTVPAPDPMAGKTASPRLTP